MNDLEKQVLKIIGENTTTPDVFDSSRIIHIRDSVNQAVQQICMVTGSYRKKYYLSLQEDLQFYRMVWKTDYFGYVIQVWDRNRHFRLRQTDVLKLDAEDPWWMQHTGNPEQYFHIGYQFLGIYMKPSSGNLVLELDCVVIPKPYTSDIEPVKLRESFENAAVQIAVSEFYASRGDASRATDWLNKGIETAGLKQLHPQMAERQWQLGGYKQATQ
jgi:hypothetical protein